MEHKLSAGPLLDARGHLSEAGWSTSLIRTYRRSDIRANRLRIKEWDYYLVMNDHYGAALTIADNSYMNMLSVSLLDFDTPREITSSIIKPLTFGRTGLPESSREGNVSFSNDRIQISFINEGGVRRLICHYLDFKDGKPFDCEITLSDEPEDSLVIATPYRDDPKAFYYNQKINCMRAEGFMSFDGRTYDFRKEDSFGCLDWGRGVWTYENTWYWSNISGNYEGHRFGWNLGYGFGDTSAASENVFFFDGKANKIGKVEFVIPKDEAGNDDFMKQWRISGERTDIVFDPLIDRASDTNVYLIRSNQHQVFGRFSGKCILDDGTEIVLKDFMGFAEKVYNRW